MMRGWMWLGAAAGAGLWLSREPGRRWLSQTTERVRDRYDDLKRRFGSQDNVQRWTGDAVAHPHPDTTMSRAFEEAVQAG